jgi:hypothetical protein
MVCMIVSTATTTVTAADGWGTLKADDEMQWQSQQYGTVTMDIISIEGDTITLELKEGGTTFSRTINADESVSSSNMQLINPYLISIANKDTYGYSTSTYDFDDTTYQAYYKKTDIGGGAISENWRDTNTGILFESRRTEADGTVNVKQKLISTTADLAESTGSYGTDTGSCLGTLLIALVTVTAVVLYSVLWKKKQR